MDSPLALLPSFDEPVLLLAITVAGGILSAVATWIGAPGWSASRRVLAILAGTILTASLGAALAGPYEQELEALPVRRVVVLDGSASLRAGERPQVTALLEVLAETARKGDGVVLYGDEIAVASIASDQILPEDLLDAFADPGELGTGNPRGTASSAGEALRVASAFHRPGEDLEIVWITDGRESPPELGQASEARASVRRLSIHLAGTDLTDSRPTRLVVPETVTAGTPFDVGLAVATSDGASAEYDLDIRPVHTPDAEPLPVHRGDLFAADGLQLFGPVRLDPGSYMVRARHVGDDAVPTNDTLYARIDVSAPPRALIVRGRSVTPVDDLIATALRAQDIAVSVASGTSGLSELLQSELVVLDDVRPEQLDAKWITALAEHVRERGAGLLITAGDQPDNHTAWNSSILADLLPVAFRDPPPAPETPEESEQGDEPTVPDLDAEPERATASVPRIGVVICIDRSGSMDTDDKLEMAKASAIRAAQVMSPLDEIAVVAFDDNSHLILPWTAAQDQATIRGQLARLAAGGGTNIYKALKMSHDVLRLRLEDFAVRHVILMTDGFSQTMGRYTQLLKQMVEDGITVTTIGIGQDYERVLLGKIAYESKGRALYVAEFAKLPLIVLEDVSHYVSLVDRAPPDDGPTDPEQDRGDEDLPTVESTDAPVESDAPEILPSAIRLSITHRVPFLETASGLPFDLPPTEGVAPADARPGALVVIQGQREAAGAEDGAFPVLVAARAGRGRVLAWCSDMGGPWTSAWFRWGDTPLFLAQILRSLLPDSPPGSYHLQLDTQPLDDDHVRVSVAAYDPGGALDRDVEWALEVTTPDGVRQVATRPGPDPGSIRAVLLLPRGDETLELRVRASRDGRLLAERRRVLQRSRFGELESLAVQGDEWRDWARAAGGTTGVLPPDRTPGSQRTRRRDLTLWPVLLAAGVLVLLAAFRRSGR